MPPTPNLSINKIDIYIAVFCLTEAVYDSYAAANEFDGSKKQGDWFGRLTDKLEPVSPSTSIPTGLTAYNTFSRAKATATTPLEVENISYEEIVNHLRTGLTASPSAKDGFWEQYAAVVEDIIVPIPTVPQPIKCLIWRQVTYETDNVQYIVDSPPVEITLNAGVTYMLHDLPLPWFDASYGLIYDEAFEPIGAPLPVNRISIFDVNFFAWEKVPANYAFLQNIVPGNARGIRIGLGCFVAGESLPRMVLWDDSIQPWPYACNTMTHDAHAMTTIPGQYDKFLPHVGTWIAETGWGLYGTPLPMQFPSGVAIDEYAVYLQVTDVQSLDAYGNPIYANKGFILSPAITIAPTAATLTIPKRTSILWWRAGQYTSASVTAQVFCPTGDDAVIQTNGMKVIIPISAVIEYLTSAGWQRREVGNIAEIDLNTGIGTPEITVPDGTSAVVGIPFNLANTTLLELMGTGSWTNTPMRVPVVYRIDYEIIGGETPLEETGYLYLNMGQTLSLSSTQMGLVTSPFDPTKVTSATLDIHLRIYSSQDFNAACFAPEWGHLRNLIHTNGYGSVGLEFHDRQMLIDNTYGGELITETYKLPAGSTIALNNGYNAIGVNIKQDLSPIIKLLASALVATVSAEATANSQLTHPVNMDNSFHMTTQVSLDYEENEPVV